MRVYLDKFPFANLRCFCCNFHHNSGFFIPKKLDSNKFWTTKFFDWAKKKLLTELGWWWKWRRSFFEKIHKIWKKTSWSWVYFKTISQLKSIPELFFKIFLPESDWKLKLCKFRNPNWFNLLQAWYRNEKKSGYLQLKKFSDVQQLRSNFHVASHANCISQKLWKKVGTLLLKQIL